MNAAVRRIRTDRPDLYTFAIAGGTSAADREAMADAMNAAFGADDGKVDMPLVFRESRLRSVAKVNRYGVVGVPGGARVLIEAMGKPLAIESHKVGLDEFDRAWAPLGADPASAAPLA